MPSPKYNWLSYKGPEALREFSRWADAQFRKLADTLKGPIAFDAGSATVSKTLMLDVGHLVQLTLAGDVAITLSTATVAGEVAYLELAQDSVGSRVPTWVNATGTGGSVTAPATGVNKKTMYVCVYSGTTWVLLVVASNYS